MTRARMGLTSSHQVGIFDVLTKALVASGPVSPADPLTGFFRYHAITPVQLSAGRDYYAVADVGPESYAIYVSRTEPTPKHGWLVHPGQSRQGKAPVDR